MTAAVLNATAAHSVRRTNRGSLFAEALRVVGRWQELAKGRRALAMMSDAQLRDVGLSPEAASTEAARPFWDAPSSWR